MATRGKAIYAEQLTDAIVRELTGYSAAIAAETKTIIAEEAERLLENVRRDSPRRKATKRGYRMVRKRSVRFERIYRSRSDNRYADGWRLIKLFEGKDALRLRVCNKTDYQLTHLLEKGHATRNGGRVRAFPHITPNEREANERILRRIREVTGQ